MERLPYIVVLICYGLATVGHLIPAALGGRLQRTARGTAATGVVTHAVTLVLGAVVNVGPPGFSEALSATSLGLGIAYVAVASGRIRSLGMLVMPACMVLLGVAQVVPPRQVNALNETGYSPWLPIHLGLVFAGVAGFALSSVMGSAYLWVRARLKQKKFGGLRSLPSLETLDRIQFRSMLFGFVFLTLGIGAGGAWATASLQPAWTFDPKVVFTLLIWLWYGIGLQVRLVMGRRGRWTALFSIVGFAGLLFSLLGVNFLLSGWHAYG